MGEKKPCNVQNKFSVGLGHIVMKKIAQELKAIRVGRPFSHLPIKKLWDFPLGLVPKKAPGKYCLMHHLHTHRAAQLTMELTLAECSICYSSTDEAVCMISLVLRGIDGVVCYQVCFSIAASVSFRVSPL